MQSSTTALATGQPLVSVMIRSVDREYLPHALASVALQTYPHIEVVVIASKPGHRTLESWCGAHPMRLIDTNTTHTRSQAANLALSHAQGQYLIFLDDDDWFMPDHIQRLVTILVALPDTKAAYTGVDLVDEQGQPMGLLDHPFDRIRLQSGNLMPIHAVLFHRSLVEQGCRFNEQLDLFEDWDFWLQVARKTSFAHLPESSAVYRIHQSSGIHEKGEQRDLAQEALARKWLQTYTPEQLLALLRRVWLANDFERQSDQLQIRIQHLLSDLNASQAQLQIRLEQQGTLQQLLMASQQAEKLQREALEQAQGRHEQAITQTSRRYQAALRTIEKLQQHHIQQQAAAEQTRIASAQQIHTLHQTIENYTQSFSWRLTAPLRWLSRVLRGAR